ncbi:MAG TPA: ABC transporter substrate-binding protein [Methylomirabilota bacterium]|nr:ABC transporter substrate-binding protein [Methylomirabilota bacterium]
MRRIVVAAVVTAGVLLVLLSAQSRRDSAEAQQAGKVPRLGVLMYGAPDGDPNILALRQGLTELGYVDSQNIKIEYRYAAGKPERLRDLAAQLAADKPDVIVAFGGDVAPIARAATSTLPIVMIVSTDPVEAGLVASMARPGGNITGVTFVSSDLAAKRLQFLKDMAPRISRVGILWNPDHVDPEYRETQKAAASLGVRLHALEVRSANDFDAAWQAATGAQLEAVIAVSSRLMTLNRQRILEAAQQRRLLLVSGWGPWAKEGALLSYGPDLDAIVGRAAGYVDKILKGAKPGDLPIEQPTKFDLVINLKTAKAFGLTIPHTVQLRASQVIE